MPVGNFCLELMRNNEFKVADIYDRSIPLCEFLIDQREQVGSVDSLAYLFEFQLIQVQALSLAFLQFGSLKVLYFIFFNKNSFDNILQLDQPINHLKKEGLLKPKCIKTNKNWSNSKLLYSLKKIRINQKRKQNNLQLIIYLFYQMKTFRQKYVYNPENPIYVSSNVKTYNCMNTETKNKKLILVEHLNSPPFVEPSQGILQPIQIPTTTEPFSVYPIVRCASQIQRIGEPQAMYIIKCISQCKLKKPLYYALSDQGVCCSEVEGILPNKSPSLFQLAIGLMGVSSNLQPNEKCVISKQGYAICKAIRQGENVSQRLQIYGWKDIKKDKDNVSDPEFLIFKGRRKQEGPFSQQYGLAWSNQHGLCRMKYISMTKDGYEEHFYNQYLDLLNYIDKSKDEPLTSKLFLKHIKFTKDSKGIKIFTQIANQGSLTQYINNKSQMGQSLSERNAIDLLNNFVEGMEILSAQFKNKGLATLHIKSLFVHNNRICIGQPLFITDNVEKKLRQTKNNMDYFAPQMKQDIILYENLQKHDKQKMDVWSFGFILHKVFAKEIPVFDPSKKPIISKDKISVGMNQLIIKCLDLNPANRLTWKQFNLKQISKKVVTIQEVKQQQAKRQQIKLGPRTQKHSQKPKSPQKKQRIVEQLQIQEDEKNKRHKQIQQEQFGLKQLSQEEDEKMPVPQQVTSKLRRIKLILKIVIIMVIYVFVFFRPFLFSSVSIIQVRANYVPVSLHLIDSQNNRISTSTILTDKADYYMNVDVGFDDVQNTYQCIDNNFDPIYNPDYQLITYVQSGPFLALLLTGWFTAVVICAVKSISIWKGGISNRPPKNVARYFVVYGFHQLTIAALLFAHFYIYQFFYFAKATPCLSITNFSGLQPLFDSSLYLFLSNNQGYFRQVFSTLGVLSIILVLSTCFYAWGPKLDQKYFSSIPSIILRIVPFILLLLICRIGVFMLFTPTAINDSTKILPKILLNSFQGFIGIIPELFILICVFVQVLIQLFMHWCEKKTAESDRLAKFFNIRRKKIGSENDGVKVNDQSMLNNSKQNLNVGTLDQY